MTEEFGMISTFGGRTPTPAIDEDQLFIAGVAFGWGDHARSQHRIFCFDKNTGELRWTNGTGGIPVDAPHNTPVIAVINGAAARRLRRRRRHASRAFQARTGKKVWTPQGLQARAQRVGRRRRRHRLRRASSEENLDRQPHGHGRLPSTPAGGKPKEVWRKRRHRGRLRLADDRTTARSTSSTTAPASTRSTRRPARGLEEDVGTIGKASLVYADGKLYVPEANGRFTIVEAAATSREVLSKVEVAGEARPRVRRSSARSRSPTGGSTCRRRPSCTASAQGRASRRVGPDPRAGEGRAGRAGREAGADPGAAGGRGAASRAEREVPGPRVRREGPADRRRERASGRSASESIAHARRSRRRRRGRRMPAPKATPKARRDAASKRRRRRRARHEARPSGAAPAPRRRPPPQPAQRRAAAQIGNLTGELGHRRHVHRPTPGAASGRRGRREGRRRDAAYARVRVFPPLPWKFDFEQAPPSTSPPLTWLGAGGKFARRRTQATANKVLTKLTDIDLYSRARTNFGTVDMSDYTVQADVKVGREGRPRGRRQIPDVGGHQQPLRAGALRQPPAARRLHVLADARCPRARLHTRRSRSRGSRRSGTG